MARGDQEDGDGFDRGSIFDRGEERQGPADNPPIIRQEDPARGIRSDGVVPPLTDQKLVMEWDAQGNPQVARVVNNRQQEQFRPPRPEEWEAVKARGYFVKGGLSGDAPAAPPADDAGFPWKKAAVVGVVVAGIWAYKNWDTVKSWLPKPQGEEEVVP